MNCNFPMKSVPNCDQMSEVQDMKVLMFNSAILIIS